MSHSSSIHIPVMTAEVVQYLNAAQGGRFLDCTLGGASHTVALLNANAQNFVVAVDRDQRAIERARTKVAPFSDRVQLVHASFTELEGELGEGRFTGMLADLGTSTDQLKEGRGFSFHDDAALDMRMDESQGITAQQYVNEASERELYISLREGGVGPEGKQIARAIVAARPLSTAKQLADVVTASLGGRHREKDTNPATVVFQALRMKVNNEVEQIESLLAAALKLVAAGGRLAVITFHSLEDQVVTKIMRDWQSGGFFSALSPGAPRRSSKGQLVEKKPILPSEAEVAANPRARSARLRVFEFS